MQTLLIAATAAGVIPIEAKAAETGATNFPIGVNTVFSAIYPPAGATQFYNYNVVYTSGNYHANLGNPNPPNFHTTVFVEAFRVNHTWVALVGFRGGDPGGAAGAYLV